jgi:hypothetical protein
MAHPPFNQWPIALALAAALAAGGCAGLSIPVGELASEGPAITGSTDAAWGLPGPLPASLAPSDAAAIAEAARHALAAESGPAVGDWTNAATGSSGTLAALGAAAEVDGETCRTFAATVTSVRGVHLYACRACRTADGRVGIRSIEAAGAGLPVTAGI